MGVGRVTTVALIAAAVLFFSSCANKPKESPRQKELADSALSVKARIASRWGYLKEQALAEEKYDGKAGALIGIARKAHLSGSAALTITLYDSIRLYHDSADMAHDSQNSIREEIRSDRAHLKAIESEKASLGK